MRLRGYIELLEQIAKIHGDELPVATYDSDTSTFRNVHSLPDVEKLIFSPCDNAWVRPTEKQEEYATLVVHL